MRYQENEKRFDSPIDKGILNRIIVQAKILEHINLRSLSDDSFPSIVWQIPLRY